VYILTSEIQLCVDGQLTYQRCFSQAEKQAIKTGVILSLELLSIFNFLFLNQLIGDPVPTADFFCS